ncbi:MAG: chlorite dismutase family protein, partial [Planctomycetes bacterium]|nr:chlorite dismutase family protein [Planctomycetota bacterium]
MAYEEKYLSFYFFKSKDSLYSADSAPRSAFASKFIDFISTQKKNGLDIRLYTCKGYREDTDFLIWLIADNFEASNQFYAGFERHFGSLFSASYIFHGMTKPSQYFKQERPQ